MSTCTEYVRALRARLIVARGGKCETCDKEHWSLEFAHKVPTELSGEGRGSLARHQDVRDNPEKYVLECMYCHSQRDGRDYTRARYGRWRRRAPRLERRAA